MLGAHEPSGFLHPGLLEAAEGLHERVPVEMGEPVEIRQGSACSFPAGLGAGIEELVHRVFRSDHPLIEKGQQWGETVRFEPGRQGGEARPFPVAAYPVTHADDPGFDPCEGPPVPDEGKPVLDRHKRRLCCVQRGSQLRRGVGRCADSVQRLGCIDRSDLGEAGEPGGLRL